MSLTVADAVLWGLAETASIATRIAPMDSKEFSPPARASAHASEPAHMHGNRHLFLHRKNGISQHNTKERRLASKVGNGGNGGQEQYLKQQRQQQQQHHQQQLHSLQTSKQAALQQQATQQQQLQRRQQQRRQQQQITCAPPFALIPPSHITVRAQRLRGGGLSDADSDGDGSDEECTPNARRVVAAEPGTPTRVAKRRLDATEHSKESEEAERWRAFAEAEEEARRWEAARKIGERKAAQARVAAAVDGRAEMIAGELRADRRIAHEQRSEAGRRKRTNGKKESSKKRRAAAAAARAEPAPSEQHGSRTGHVHVCVE